MKKVCIKKILSSILFVAYASVPSIWRSHGNYPCTKQKKTVSITAAVPIIDTGPPTSTATTATATANFYPAPVGGLIIVDIVEGVPAAPVLIPIFYVTETCQAGKQENNFDTSSSGVLHGMFYVSLSLLCHEIYFFFFLLENLQYLHLIQQYCNENYDHSILFFLLYI